jgi:CRISPR-associated protein Cas1
MPSLYITEPGAAVRKSGESFVVTVDDDPDGAGPLPEKHRKLLEVEAHRLELVALVGRVHATSDAVQLCLERGIAIAWFKWNGDYLGRLVPEGARSADLRLLQYAAAHEPASRLARARGVVAAKLANAAAVLGDVQSNEAGSPSLGAAIAELRKRSGDAPSAAGAESLLGVEGAGTRTYFEAFGGAFKADIRFEGRERRPPPDPANALLSFGYVLLGNLLAGMLEARGLDPALGFFHEVRPGRASLALDMLEELRFPVVDRFVLRGCNLRVFRSEMFEPDPDRPGGVRLTADGHKTFFREWEAHLARPLREKGAAAAERLEVRGMLRRQIDRLAADLRGGAVYAPFEYGE